MLSKKELRQTFARDWKKYYDAGLQEKGFARKACGGCGKNFWTLDPERKRCGDPPCSDYDFLDRPVTRKRLDYIEMWKQFEKYFRSQGHESIPRYPTICRWREDLYFTIASIVDFQRLENGKMAFDYPADKLIVPQACLRFGDIPNVGVTGRHLTSFVMTGQHSFGYPRTGYWKKECIGYNYEFLTKVMGVDPERLTYVEDVWAMPDFSMFGSCLEAFVGGVETVNNVFSEFTATPNGFGPLDLKVIDVGWGHERLVWLSNSTPTIYDAAFGPVIEKMKRNAGVKVDAKLFGGFARIAGSLNIDEAPDVELAWKQVAAKLGVDSASLRQQIEPLQALYAVCDHARSLAFAIADGGIPSNAGGGYNLRVILRRALSFIDEHEFPFSVKDVAGMHARYLKPVFPELAESLPALGKIVGVEEAKFRETSLKSRKLVSQQLSRSARFDNATLTTLYESHGITPELIHEVARKEGKRAEIPGDFYTSMTSRHEQVEIKPKKSIDVGGLPQTVPLYYTSPSEFEFTARVIKVLTDDGKHYAILDKTAFYPEGGGQQCDLGFIAGKRVLHVSKTSGVVLHQLENVAGILAGSQVACKVDEKRRKRLMRHHTAVHIVNGAVRKVLGSHAWQAGAEKTPEKARLDVTHYELPSQKQVAKIEKLANDVVKKGTKVSVTEMERHAAESRYGFSLYQGGIAPARVVRVVDVSGFDTECCGGTHCHSAREVGDIRIIGVKKIQDGVIRFELVAGRDLVEKSKREEKLNAKNELASWKEKLAAVRKQVAELGGKPGKAVPAGIERLVVEWRKEGKRLEQLRKRFLTVVDEPVQLVDTGDMRVLQEMGDKLTEENGYCVLIGKGVVFARGSGRSSVDVGSLAKLAAVVMGGGAGGRGNEFKGGGPLQDKSGAAYAAVLEKLGRMKK